LSEDGALFLWFECLPENVVIARTEYLDCSCLGVLIAKLLTWRECEPGTNLRLQNVNRDIATVLRLLKLDEVFVVKSVSSDPAA
jgi:anti-anti-sigma regulatory factor